MSACLDPNMPGQPVAEGKQVGPAPFSPPPWASQMQINKLEGLTTQSKSKEQSGEREDES